MTYGHDWMMPPEADEMDKPMTPRESFVEAMKGIKESYCGQRGRNLRHVRAACVAFAEGTWPDGVYAPNAKADYIAAILRGVGIDG